MPEVLPDLLAGLSDAERTVLVLTASFAAALLLEFVVFRLARRVVTETGTELDNIVVDELRWPIVVTAALAGVFVITQSQNGPTTVFTEAQIRSFFDQPAATIVVLLWGYALNRIVNRAVEAVDKTDKYDFAPVFSNVWTFTVLLGTAFLVLTIWGIEVTPLLGAAGIAGIAIGFAAKDTVANFFGGLALYFDDTYKIGDYIELDTGDAGTVVRVGVRSTTLLTRDELMVTVPNAVLNSASITNESAPQRRRRIRVEVGVAYGTDIDAFEDRMVELAKAESLVLDSPKPRMRLREFGGSALEYELLCWVRTPTKRAKAEHHLNRAIYKACDDAGFEIPFPQRDVTVSVPDEVEAATRSRPAADATDVEERVADGGDDS